MYPPSSEEPMRCSEHQPSFRCSLWLVVALAVPLMACCDRSGGLNQEPRTAEAPTAGSAGAPTPQTPVATAAPPPPAAPSPGEAPTGKANWTFDDDSPGKLPTGFVASTGRWEVIKSNTAPNVSPVLAQLATSADDVYNVVLITSEKDQDVDISVRLRSVSGRVDQGGGLVWRARDERNYYIARYNPLEDNFRIYTVVDGRRKMLQSVKLRIDHAGWHTLRIVMRGDHIECYLNGTKHFDLLDPTFSDAGQIGLWTKADAQTHFDDLTLGSAAPSEGAP